MRTCLPLITKKDLDKLSEISNFPFTSNPIVNPIDNSTAKTVYQLLLAEFMKGKTSSFYNHLPDNDKSVLVTAINHSIDLIKNNYEINSEHKNEKLFQNINILTFFNEELMPSRNSVFIESINVFFKLRNNPHLDKTSHIELSKNLISKCEVFNEHHSEIVKLALLDKDVFGTNNSETENKNVNQGGSNNSGDQGSNKNNGNNGGDQGGSSGQDFGGDDMDLGI